MLLTSNHICPNNFNSVQNEVVLNRNFTLFRAYLVLNEHINIEHMGVRARIKSLCNVESHNPKF